MIKSNRASHTVGSSQKYFQNLFLFQGAIENHDFIDGDFMSFSVKKIQGRNRANPFTDEDLFASFDTDKLIDYLNEFETSSKELFVYQTRIIGIIRYI